MCSIDTYPLKGIMDNRGFEAILDKFVPCRKKIKFISLVGIGEPLADKDLVAKVKMTMDKGFANIGFPTNAMALTEGLSLELIHSGLSTIIFSIDGITKEIHEAIRKGTNFDVIMANVLRFIELRNQYGKTKVIVRIIRQNLNESQIEAFENFWKQQLETGFGDQVAVYDVYDHVNGKDNVGFKKKIDELSEKKKIICADLLERFVIQLNGNVLLCCGGMDATLNLGNIYRDDPIEIYNNEIFTFYRNMMDRGKLANLEPCKHCEIYLSKANSFYQNV
jgi:radical SAM protein with 4Fe4S-binding SPASM domain